MTTVRATVLAVALAAGVAAHPFGLAAQKPAAAAEHAGRQRVEFTVVGLSCPFCAYGLEKRLRREIVGLDSLGLDLKSGTVTLEVQDGAKVSDEQLRDAVKKAGFSVVGDVKRLAPVESRSPGFGAPAARLVAAPALRRAGASDAR